MKADDSRPTSVSGLPAIDTSNKDLCGLCLQALTIDDQLAGGTMRVNASDGTSILDISGFAHNDWERNRININGVREERVFDKQRKEDREEFGKCRGYSPCLCAGDGRERLVTLPEMPEISGSAVGPCPFCSTLRALFIAQYAEHSWWNEPGSTLRFSIQYEWGEYRSILDGEDEAVTFRQGLMGLAVLVDRPGLNISGVPDRPGLMQPNRRDVFNFDVVAWPGTSHEVLLFTASTNR